MTYLTRRGARAGLLASLAALALLALASPASATFAGKPGRIVFWDFANGQISSVNPNGTGLRQLTHTDPDHAAIRPSWSRDGRRIVFSMVRNGTPDDHARIWIMRADGSGAHLLAPDRPGFRDYIPKFTRDGRHIVFSHCLPDNGVCAIWRMRSDGTHMQPLTHFKQGLHEAVDFDASVAADGRIAFGRFFGGGVVSRIWVMRGDGSHARPVTPSFLEGFAPDFSPNDRTIAFSTDSNRFGSELWAVSPGGAALRQVTHTRFPQNDATPSYSPAGNRIAFVTDRLHPDLCCLDVATSRPDGSDRHIFRLAGVVGALDPSWGTAPRGGAAASLTAAPATATPPRALRLPGLCAADARLRDLRICH